MKGSFFIISGLEQSLIKIKDDTIAVIRMLLAGKSVKEIATTLELPLKEIEEIKEKFESN